MTSELRRLHGTFADDNPLLYASLGLLSSFRTLDRIVDEHAPRRPSPAPAVAEGAGDARGIELVLGLLALRMRIESRLREASGPDAVPGVGASRPGVREEPLASFFR